MDLHCRPLGAGHGLRILNKALGAGIQTCGEGATPRLVVLPPRSLGEMDSEV